MSSSIEETARYLCMSQKQIYQLLKNGELRVNKVNGRAVINQGIVLDYLARKRPYK